MSTDLAKLEQLARLGSRSLADLEQMKANMLGKGEIEAAKLLSEVIVERFPVRTKSGGGRTPTVASFRGHAQEFDSGKDAYLWLAAQFQLFRPALFEDFQAFVSRRALPNSGTRFAQTPDELFPRGSNRAGNASYFAKLPGGWFADTNLNHQDKFATLLKLAYVAKLEYPTHWEFRPVGSTSKLREHQEAVVRARELLAELMRA